MKTLCPPSYHLNGFVATHALGHMLYDYIYLYYTLKSNAKGLSLKTDIFILVSCLISLHNIC